MKDNTAFKCYQSCCLGPSFIRFFISCACCLLRSRFSSLCYEGTKKKDIIKQCCFFLYKVCHHFQTHLFLKALAHLPVQVIAGAKELQEIVLRSEKIDIVWFSVWVKPGGILREGLTSVWHCLRRLIISLHSSVCR